MPRVTEKMVDTIFNIYPFHFFDLEPSTFIGSSAYPVGSSWTDMTKDAALMGHTSETVTMSSCTLCVMKCWYHRDCLSVNCGKEGSMDEYQCQLNTANRVYPSATSLVPHSYLSYYDIVYEGKEFA